AAVGAPFRSSVCFLAGGETTVTVRGRGTGGRCQEFALAGALQIEGLTGATLAAFSTDGADGPPGRNPPVAGAVADGRTAARARARNIDPRRMLDRNDAYSFFQKVGGLIRTGPTRTHLNDLYLLMIERPE
ncbi:MAG TPA: MOFRL family protein, partial [Nitrospiria bacterium]|nr:MOFRL family protein [Nitrospiria bacterium]